MTSRYERYRHEWDNNWKNDIVANFPLNVDIELTNICNLKCTFCSSVMYPYKKKGYMTKALFIKLIDEGADNGLYAIKFSWRGEPLLHPDIVSFAAYAKQRGIMEVIFNTNAYYLDLEKANGLIDAGVDQIWISFEGCTKEIYESHRVNSDYDRVLSNIKNLCNIKKRHNSLRPLIQVNSVRIPDVVGQDLQYMEFWEQYADEVVIKDMMEYDENVVLGYAEPEFKCPALWQRLTVAFDGNVRPCCKVMKEDRYYKTGISLGDANTDALRDIWHGEKLNGMRKLHAHGNSHVPELCADCPYRVGSGG